MPNKKKKNDRTRRNKHQEALSDPETVRLFGLVKSLWPEMRTWDREDCCKSLLDRGCTVAGLASDLGDERWLIQALLDQQKRKGRPPRSIEYIVDHYKKSDLELLVENMDTRSVDIDPEKIAASLKTTVEEIVTPTPSPSVTEVTTALPMAAEKSDEVCASGCRDLAAAMVWLLATEAKEFCSEPWLTAVFSEAMNDLYGLRNRQIQRPREAGESLIDVVGRCRPAKQFGIEPIGVLCEWLDELARTIESDAGIRIEAAKYAKETLQSCPPDILDLARRYTPHSFLQHVKSQLASSARV